MFQALDLPFPQRSELSRTDFESRFRIVTVGHRNPQLAHQLATPRQCEFVPAKPLAPGNGGLFSPISRFESPADDRLAVTVSVSRLSRSAAPADWLRIELDQLRQVVVRRTDVNTPAGQSADVLTRITSDGRGRAVARHLVVADGPRVFRIEASVAESAYRLRAEDLMVAVASFRLVGAERSVGAEPLACTRLAGSGGRAVSHPASWKLEYESTAAELSQGVLCSRFEGRVSGRICLLRASRSGADARAMTGAFLRWLQQTGVHTRGAALHPVGRAAEWPRIHYFDGGGASDGAAFDTPALVCESADDWTLLGLVSPTYETSPQWWAINKRAFEIVRDSLRIGEAMGDATLSNAGEPALQGSSSVSRRPARPAAC